MCVCVNFCRLSDDRSGRCDRCCAARRRSAHRLRCGPLFADNADRLVRRGSGPSNTAVRRRPNASQRGAGKYRTRKYRDDTFPTANRQICAPTKTKRETNIMLLVARAQSLCEYNLWIPVQSSVALRRLSTHHHELKLQHAHTTCNKCIVCVCVRVRHTHVRAIPSKCKSVRPSK